MNNEGLRVHPLSHLSRAEQLLAMGDRPLEKQIQSLHWLIKPAVEESGIFNHVQSDGQTALSHAQQEYLTTLLEEGKSFHDNLHPSLDDQRPEASRIRSVFSSVARLYRKADTSTQVLPPEDKVAERLSRFSGYQIITDMDNTITDHGKLPKPVQNGVDPLLLGSDLADPLHGPERRFFPAAFAAIWAPLVEQYPSVYRDGGKQAPLREGMKEFLSEESANGTPIMVVSTNFTPFVEGVLSNIQGSDTFEVFAAYPTIIPSQKADVIKHQVLKNPELAAIYIGDGSSDLPALAAREYVAVYFALKGSKFEEQLALAGIPYFNYTTGYDIQRKLRELISIKKGTSITNKAQIIFAASDKIA